MSAAARRREFIVPMRLTWIAFVNFSSGVASPSRVTSLAPVAMPAQAIRMRGGPSASRKVAIAASWLAASETSQTAAAPPNSPATLRANSSFMSSTPTDAPADANMRAVASPSPDAPPVT